MTDQGSPSAPPDQPKPKKKYNYTQKTGKPTDYRPEFIPKLLEMAAEGKSFTAIAVEFDVVRDTMWDWGKRHKEFGDAMRRAKQLQIAFFEKIGMTAMQGGTKGFKSDMWTFWMKARFGWREDGPSDEPQEDTELEIK